MPAFMHQLAAQRRPALPARSPARTTSSCCRVEPSLSRQIEALIQRRPQRIVDAQLERIGAGVADGGAGI